MELKIRKMRAGDREQVLSMMRVFYAGPAVHTDGSEEIFESDFQNCIGDSPFLEGYMLEADGAVCGYAMLARSFSTEFGKPCIWIEDIYFREESRGKGFGRQFFAFLEEQYSGVIFRLEAEPDNLPAVHLYRKAGYEAMEYLELKKDGPKRS